jgi:hypothetical protein
MFNSIKRYYDMGKYTNEQVKILSPLTPNDGGRGFFSCFL